jgi:cell division protein FtsI (penicillin-binding protein 3)
MRNATPAVTQYVTYARAASASASERRDELRALLGRPAAVVHAAQRRRQRAAWPIRAARCWPRRRRRGDQVHRRAGRPGFVVLLGRALYVQVLGSDFYQEAGRDPLRAHDRPAGQPWPHPSTATGRSWPSSVPAPSLWVLPKDFEADRAQRRQLASLLGMTPSELDEQARQQPQLRLAAPPGRGADRQGRDGAGPQGHPSGARVQAQVPRGRGRGARGGLHRRRRSRPGGRGVRFHEGELSGATAPAASSRTGWAAWSRTSATSVARVDGRDLRLTIDTKIQFFAYQRVRDAVAEHKRQGGSVVVLDVATGGVLALANYPSFTPGDRRNRRPRHDATSR